jgi:hypothetical protein
MRKGRRNVLAPLGIALFGTLVHAAQFEALPASGTPVRVTLELSWGVHGTTADTDALATPAPTLELKLSEGRVVEELTWPNGAGRKPERGSPGTLDLGPGRTGRIRVLIEAPLGASLRLERAGQATLIPLLALIEGPQRTPPQAPLEIVAERLPWDALLVDPGSCDGTAAPGAIVPISVGYNILTPEPTEISVRSTVKLRPIAEDQPLWQDERHELVATNRVSPGAQVWNVPAPTVEGTYVLDLETTWEPVPSSESTRLGRWIRRRRNPQALTSSVRRLTLVVLAPKPPPRNSVPLGPLEQEVEAIDLARLRGYRPMATGRAALLAPGRATWPVPEAALVEASARDRLRGWIMRSGTEAANLGAADTSGLAWSALGLKVNHPGRPHRLTLTVGGGHPAALGVALLDSPGPGRGGRPRVVLDACASGPAIHERGPATTFSWLVWPQGPDPVVVIVNRDPHAPVQLGTVALTELAEVPSGPALLEPEPATRRTLGLYLADPNALDRFGFGGGETVPGDPLALARNLAQYTLTCGASAVVLPERLADRARRRALDGQASEDSLVPDHLDLLLRVLARQECSAWLELTLEQSEALPGLPAPGSPEAQARGLVRVDREGHGDGPVYHPLHPDVGEALKRRVVQAVAPRRSRPSLAGVLIRLGRGPTLLGGPDTGFDDATYARFVRETFDAETARGVPGLDAARPDRFAARTEFLAGSGRMPWLTWRSRRIAALYAELAEAVRAAAPRSLLAVVTPGLEDSPVGQEARQVDLAGLRPSHAWRAVGLDLETWPGGDAAPVVLRGADLSTDALAHDLATSPDLDALVAARAARGLLLVVGESEPSTPTSTRPDGLNANPNPSLSVPRDTGLRLSALPLSEGPESDEPLGHAVAALDARWVLLAMSAVAGHEERIRRFARTFRALPAAAPGESPALDRLPFGVAVRTIPQGELTYLALANDTPYPIRLDTLVGAPATATIDDLGRGMRLKPEATPDGRHLVLDLLPFGVAAVRINAPRVRVATVTPYPSEAAKASLQARYNELSDQLSRLNRSPTDGRAGPLNPGFEPNRARAVQLTVARSGSDAGSSPGPGPGPGGWQLMGNPANSAEIDSTQFHTGQGSLRIDARTPPATVASDRFVPDVQASLTIQAWFRSDQPDTKVRVWIEGESAGQPFVRRSELSVPTEWTPLAVRTTEIPAAGLTGARLRFELLGSGRLWVDDLSLTSEVLSETERLNVQRALIAALQAYREKRYADFARLAGSHWARLPDALRVAAAEGHVLDRPGLIRTGGTTPLPPDRRLR